MTDTMPSRLQAPAAEHWLDRATLLGLLAFVLLFGLMMTIEPKKFDRYLLPIFG